jgi:hypothetical protein
MTADGKVRGDAFLVYLHKEIVVRNGTELNRNNGQRDWRAKFGASFDGAEVPPDRLFEVIKAANHGYKGSMAAHDMVLQLATAVGGDVEEMRQYYSHCRAVQRDLSHLGEEDLDYLDLFGDSKREKLYVEGGSSRTVACVADCLRLHPKLMEASWNPQHAKLPSPPSLACPRAPATSAATIVASAAAPPASPSFPPSTFRACPRSGAGWDRD